MKNENEGREESSIDDFGPGRLMTLITLGYVEGRTATGWTVARQLKCLGGIHDRCPLGGWVYQVAPQVGGLSKGH